MLDRHYRSPLSGPVGFLIEIGVLFSLLGRVGRFQARRPRRALYRRNYCARISLFPMRQRCAGLGGARAWVRNARPAEASVRPSEPLSVCRQRYFLAGGVRNGDGVGVEPPLLVFLGFFGSRPLFF
jgi:hypothetical protein